jgi:hypothetical protein
VQVNLSSDSPFSQLYIGGPEITRKDAYRITLYAEKASLVVTINRKDLEAIENAIADTLRPIPVVTDRLADELLGQVRT